MLSYVRERFLKIADRHLKEASQWLMVSDAMNEENKLWGAKYATMKADEHLRMVEYWHMACDKLHYVPGTWAYRF